MGAQFSMLKLDLRSNKVNGSDSGCASPVVCNKVNVL